MEQGCAHGASLPLPGKDTRLNAGGFQMAGKASGWDFIEEVESLGS